jgi:hypothetical protein
VLNVLGQSANEILNSDGTINVEKLTNDQISQLQKAGVLPNLSISLSLNNSNLDNSLESQFLKHSHLENTPQLSKAQYDDLEDLVEDLKSG